jgi:ribosomal 50S subunit-recycling heat shock protein
MRLDYFLKISRIVKRRPLAKEMCDKKLVHVNEQLAKAGKEVAVGDLLTVKFPHRTVKVRIERIPERAAAKKEAAELYVLLEDRREQGEDLPDRTTL